MQHLTGVIFLLLSFVKSNVYFFSFFYKMFKKGVDTSVFDVYNGGKWCGSGAEMAESVEKLWQCMENLRIEWMIRGGLFFLFPCVRFSEISSLLQKA